MRILLFLITILLFTACGEEKPPLDKKQMSEIMADMHLAESYAQLVPVKNGEYMSTNRDTLRVLYQNIYKKNKLDTTAFFEALAWYEAHPKVFDKVYEDVLEKLSVRKEIFKDSISKSTDSIKAEIKDSLKD